MNAQLINVKNASVTLHNHGEHNTILKNINFCLNLAEHVAILGPNGAGKSTFLRMLAGEVWIDQGTGHITWQYNNVAEQSPIMARRMCALVNAAKQEQYTSSKWQLSGKDILLTALYSTCEETQAKDVQNMAEQLGCSSFLNMQAQALSQGQLRLLLLGQALLKKPKVLLLDEYLDGLDAYNRSKIFCILEQLSSTTTMVISTHRPQDLMPWVSKKLFMHDGKLQAQPVARKTSKPCKHTSYQTTKKITALPIIAVRKATVFVDRTIVLHNINWQLHKGEHWLIHGKNGSGKSTFLRLLAGDEHPAVGGTIKRHFANLFPCVENTTKLEHIRKAIRLVSDYEQACYGYDLKGLEFILSGIDNVIGTYRDFTDEEVENALNIMKHFKLNNLEVKHIRNISTGQLRRLFIARALITKPEVLLLDEPFSGLDQTSRLQCMDNLDDIAEFVHIILVSHHNDDRLASINREARFENGHLIL